MRRDHGQGTINARVVGVMCDDTRLIQTIRATTVPPD
ncbi:hypothetical protein J2S46_000350 [Kitasatospora herbaricolor]|nr:hypothetical protein [Kitasatospora herbaricolor]